MHWDNECCHSRKGERMARVNLVRLEDDDVRAQEEYDSLFYELDSDTEGESTQQDFCRPSSVLTFLTNRVTQIRKNWRICLAWRELKVLTDFWVRKLFSHRTLV